MGVVVFITIADENLPDVTQLQNMFMDEVGFIHVTQQRAMNTGDPLQVTNKNSGRKTCDCLTATKMTSS